MKDLELDPLDFWAAGQELSSEQLDRLEKRLSSVPCTPDLSYHDAHNLKCIVLRRIMELKKSRR